LHIDKEESQKYGEQEKHDEYEQEISKDYGFLIHMILS